MPFIRFVGNLHPFAALAESPVSFFVGVVFFGAVFLGDGNVAFGSCADLVGLAGRCDGMQSIAIGPTIKTIVR